MKTVETQSLLSSLKGGVLIQLSADRNCGHYLLRYRHIGASNDHRWTCHNDKKYDARSGLNRRCSNGRVTYPDREHSGYVARVPVLQL